jgi:hypothetical protein
MPRLASMRRPLGRGSIRYTDFINDIMAGAILGDSLGCYGHMARRRKYRVRSRIGGHCSSKTIGA